MEITINRQNNISETLSSGVSMARGDIKVLCVYTVDDYFSIEKPLQTNEEIPFGISMIATIIKNCGASVDLMVLTDKTFNHHIRNYAVNESPDLICLTAVSSQFNLIKKISVTLRGTFRNAFIILGGHHASLAPDDAIMHPSIDAICVGEGDYAVKKILTLMSQGKRMSNIPNLWIKLNGIIERNERLPFEQDLNQLPFIDRKMWREWVAYPDDNASILVGRGCPYRCTYCSNHAMKRLSKGRYVRYRSPENIVEEINEICKNNNINFIYLEVETVGADIVLASKIFEALKEFNNDRNNPINFGINLAYHSSFSKDKKKVRDFLGKCRDAGVIRLNIGLESGSERIRKDVLRRPRHTNNELIEFMSDVRQHNIGVILFLLMAVPGETPKDFQESVKIIRKIKPETVYLSIFYPYIGTDLYNISLENNLIPNKGLDDKNERTQVVLRLPGYPYWKIKRDYILFWYYCFKGDWSYLKIFAFTVKAVISSVPYLQNKYKYIMSHSSNLVNIKNMIIPNKK